VGMRGAGDALGVAPGIRGAASAAVAIVNPDALYAGFPHPSARLRSATVEPYVDGRGIDNAVGLGPDEALGSCPVSSGGDFHRRRTLARCRKTPDQVVGPQPAAGCRSKGGPSWWSRIPTQLGAK
jgi:hypothetical protein